MTNPAVSEDGLVEWDDEDMAMHWIDRYAAGIDGAPQMDRILDCVKPTAALSALPLPVEGVDELTKPIGGIEYRHPVEVFDMMVSRIKGNAALRATPAAGPSAVAVKEIVDALAALEPFAKIAGEYSPREDDDFNIMGDKDVLGEKLTLRKFRRARDARTALSCLSTLAPSAAASDEVERLRTEINDAWVVFGNVPRDKPLADHVAAALNELADIAENKRALASPSADAREQQLDVIRRNPEDFAEPYDPPPPSAEAAKPVAWTITDEMVEASFRYLKRVIIDNDTNLRRFARQSLSAAQSASPPALSQPQGELREGKRWRHKKRGSTYTEIGRGRMQVDGDMDMERVVIYRAVGDGEYWVRPVYEFEHRFEAIDAALAGRAAG